MNRFTTALVVVAAAGLGLIIGGAVVLSAANDTAPSGTVRSSTTSMATTTTTEPTTTNAPRPSADPFTLVWTSGGLPAEFADAARVLNTTGATSVVAAGTVGLTESRDASGGIVDRTEPGWQIALDVIAVDPDAHRRVHARRGGSALPRLGPDEAVLGSTSAELRRLGPGSTLRLGGRTIAVVAVVRDELIGGSEVAVDDATGAALGVTGPRYALLRHTEPRADLESRLREALPPDRPVRFRSEGETPFLRNGDAVLPPAQIKAAFGEFMHRPTAGREIVVDPAWIDEHLVTEEIPVLGSVYCNRALMPALRGAMGELVDRDLDHLVASYEGCVNPHTLGGPGGPPSRHSWGAAIDVNFGANVTGVRTEQDPRLVEVMERWGFGNGDDWLIPDSGHFEYLGPPSGP